MLVEVLSALSGAIGVGLYSLALRNYARAAEIASAERVHDVGLLKAELREAAASLPTWHRGPTKYVVVTGIARSLEPLQAPFSAKPAVIFKQQVIEHLSRWSSPTKSWVDETRIVSSAHEAATSWFLEHGTSNLSSVWKGTHSIAVKNCLKADYIQLTRAYTQLREVPGTVTSALLAALYGVQVKAFEDVEEILPLNATTTIIGQIRLQSGQLVLSPSTRFQPLIILQSKSVEDIATEYREFARMAYGVTVVFFVAATCGIVYLGWKRREQGRARQMALEEQRRKRAMLRDFRQREAEEARRRAQGRAAPEEPDPIDLSCLICAGNDREVVVVPCGHFCMCQSCGAALTRCPVCQGPITQLIRSYIS